ncbi:MAG: MFS transporter [Cellvibrionales bacterium]|nr:MFS transporter [Cellvibrionales bacterium]
MIKFFRTAKDCRPLELPKSQIKKRFINHQWQVFLGLLAGYAVFYIVRMSLSVAKKPLLDSGLFSLEELGLIGSAFFFTYAVGKFSNGMLSDYAHIGRFMSSALLLSGITCVLLGFTTHASLFIFLWGLNGWFQSVGSVPSAVSIFQWFTPKQRGTRYAIWGGARNLGEGLTWLITTSIVSYFGFQAGFIASGTIAVFVALSLFYFLKDRPATYGFPEPFEVFDEPPESSATDDPKKTKRAQVFSLKQPAVWLIGLSCAAMTTTRYAISSWAVLFLQEAKGYSLMDAGFTMAAFPTAGFIGAILSGLISDKLFNANRNIPTLIYGLANIIGLACLFYGPDNRWLDAAALTLIGFSIGGLVVFLGGLIVCDLMPKSAAGAVKGFVGLFAYVAAGIQEVASSKLISQQTLGEITTYDFAHVKVFWLTSSIISLLLALSIWNIRKIDSMPEEIAMPTSKGSTAS